MVLSMPTGGAVRVHGCGVGSRRRARPSAWPRLWRRSMAGVVREHALALRRPHGAGGVSPSVRARSRRGRAAPPPAPWAWRRVVPGMAACCRVRWPLVRAAGRAVRQARPGGRRRPGGGAGHGGATCPPPVSLAHVSRHRPRPTGGCGFRRPGWCRRGGRRSGTGKPGGPVSVPSTPTRACRRRPAASARASLPLPGAPEAWRSASMEKRRSA